VAGGRHPIVAASGLALAASLVAAGGAEADPFSVTSTANTGPGTLRQAVTDANAHAGADTITFATSVTGAIDLSTAVHVTDPLTITGPGARALELVRTSNNNLITATGADLTVSGLTLLGGQSTLGGAIAADSGSLTLSGDAILESSAGYGGGVYVHNGHLTVTSSTLSGDSATSGGGAIEVYGSSPATGLSISDSTLAGNSGSVGGAIFVVSNGSGPPQVDITGSTIAGNVSDAGGGAAFLQRADAQIQDSIIADNPSISAADFVEGTPGPYPITASFSLLDARSAAKITESVPGSDIVGLNPRLDPLANNGGPTDTLLPELGSPEIDHGKAPGPTDQRGLPRPFGFLSVPDAAGGDGSDIGAVEVQGVNPRPAVTSLSPARGAAGTQVIITGTSLDAAGGVKFGAVPATFRQTNGTQIIAKAPAHAAGRVNVTVTSPAGRSAAGTADHFTYPAVRPKPPAFATKGTAKLKHGRTGYTLTPGVSITCPKGGPTCKITLRATTKTTAKRRTTTHTTKRKTTTHTVARHTLTVKAGKKDTVSIKLSKAVLALLAKAKTLKISLSLTGRAGTSTTTKASKTITLHAPKTKTKKHG
jgi:IPT/TIG domain